MNTGESVATLQMFSIFYGWLEVTFANSLLCNVLTLAELHVLVLTNFIKLIKLFQNLMKLLPNHIMV